MPSVRVRVPATSANLGPGFDSLGLALRFYNHVSIGDAAADSSERITVRGEGIGAITGGDDNIAVVAARAVWQAAGAPASAWHMELDNGIPLSRGLGSSAAARCGALVAANEWSRLQGWPVLAEQELLSLAARLEGHPDNAAAALLGGLVVSAMPEAGSHRPTAGAVAMRLPVPGFPRLVLFVPDVELSTATARGVLPDNIFRKDADFNISRTALLLAALVTGQWELLREALQDRLHQEHRAVLMPGFHAITRAAVAAGAYGATLSGAGPTILAWLPHDDSITARVLHSMPAAAAEHEVFGRAFQVEVEPQGCVVTTLPTPPVGRQAHTGGRMSNSAHDDWYFDSQGEPQSQGAHVRFERIYRLDFEKFDESHWAHLDSIYDHLPGERFDRDVPFWFGLDDDGPPYLYVSVEPKGLQVAGVLPLQDWLRWDEAFRKLVEASPLPIQKR